MMKISYLITCSTETDTLLTLLGKIGSQVHNSDDEVVVLIDSEAQNNNTTKEILSKFAVAMAPEMTLKKTCKILEHPLNNDYGNHKNFGNQNCTGDYIFQIDGDEIPSEMTLGENLHAIIESNPSVELIFVPRMNTFLGVTPEHAKQWGWRLTESPSLKTPLVNWPDYQGRIYKNVSDRIKWDRRLHEKIEGHVEYSLLPEDEELAMLHIKSIEKQIQTNIRYNKAFTEDENKGHKVV